MSNYLTIEPTRFTNVRTGDSTVGVRVYDEYIQAYDNTLISIPDDDMDLLELVLEAHHSGGEIGEALDSVREDEKCLFIGGLRYEWDEVKHLFEQYG